MTLTKRNHVLEETENVLVGLQLAPVQPSSFVVLVIRIVVSELRVEELVAGSKHRYAIRQHEQAGKILCLLAPQGQHVIGDTFVAFITTVPAVVGVGAILVVVAIRPVVLLVIGDEIEQREAVMRSNEIYALIRMIGIEAIIGK